METEILFDENDAQFIVIRGFLEKYNLDDPAARYDTLCKRLVQDYKMARSKFEYTEYDIDDDSTDLYIDDALEEEYALPVAPRYARRFISYGQPCKMHRSQLFLSNVSQGYVFSGKLLRARRLTKYFSRLLDTVNKHFETDFNSILINEYLDGQDYISDHSDNEETLSSDMVVGLSIGATRVIKIKEVATKKTILSYENRSGELFIMKGSQFQSRYTHGIPPLLKTLAKKTEYQGRRVSFTFRTHTK